MSRSRCEINRELVFDVMRQLEEMARLSTEQKLARGNDEIEKAAALDQELDLAFGEKERRVGAWQQHAREHGC